jgi:peptidoglycan hydrolase-like protein with peptidoglycan-binding domain
MPLNRRLQIGSQGRDVVEIQTDLNIIGMPFMAYGTDPPSRLPQLKIDGLYGPLTDRRVREFQRDRDLVSDGIVGPKTYRAIRNIGVPDGEGPEYSGAFAIWDPKRFRTRRSQGSLFQAGVVLTLIFPIAGSPESRTLGVPYPIPR